MNVELIMNGVITRITEEEARKLIIEMTLNRDISGGRVVAEALLDAKRKAKS